MITAPAPVNNTDAATKKYVDDKDALDVHLAGPETITGKKNVPLEVTGTFSDQIASSNKVKNELDNYALVVRTTDYQIIPGVKVFEGYPGSANTRNPNIDITSPPAGDTIVGQWQFMDVNNVVLGSIIGVVATDGSTYINATVRNIDGTYKAVRLITSD